MRAKRICFFVACLLMLGCQKKSDLTADISGNPVRKSNKVFKSYEDLGSPKFAALREKYKIDTAFHGEQDEFMRQLVLRNWIRTIVSISDFEAVYPGEGYPEQILDAALKGQGYHCGHFMTVQNAVMNGYGYVTRCLGAGPGVKGGPDGHHGVNEVWSNKYQKWYLSDAKYDHHFSKNGIPLSALEIREEFLKNGCADVALLKGPDQVQIDSDTVAAAGGRLVQKKLADFAQTYTWIEWESYNDRYTNWPETSDNLSILIMYEDDYFRNNTWIWDGRPHWAYTAPGHMVRIRERDAIEWTPNTLSAEVLIANDSATVQLSTDTPNFKTYQMKRESEEEWTDILNPAKVQVTGVDEEILLFRTVNLANVAGPEYRIAFRSAE